MSSHQLHIFDSLHHTRSMSQHRSYIVLILDFYQWQLNEDYLNSMFHLWIKDIRIVKFLFVKNISLPVLRWKATIFSFAIDTNTRPRIWLRKFEFYLKDFLIQYVLHNTINRMSKPNFFNCFSMFTNRWMYI